MATVAIILSSFLIIYVSGQDALSSCDQDCTTCYQESECTLSQVGCNWFEMGEPPCTVNENAVDEALLAEECASYCNEYWGDNPPSVNPNDITCYCVGGMNEITFKYLGPEWAVSITFYQDNRGPNLYENCNFENIAPNSILTCKSQPQYDTFINSNVYITIVYQHEKSESYKTCKDIIHTSCAQDIMYSDSEGQCGFLEVIGYGDNNGNKCPPIKPDIDPTTTTTPTTTQIPQVADETTTEAPLDVGDPDPCSEYRSSQGYHSYRKYKKGSSSKSSSRSGSGSGSGSSSSDRRRLGSGSGSGSGSSSSSKHHSHSHSDCDRQWRHSSSHKHHKKSSSDRRRLLQAAVSSPTTTYYSDYLGYLASNCECNSFTINVYGDDSKSSMDDYYDIPFMDNKTYTAQAVGVAQNDKVDLDNDHQTLDGAPPQHQQHKLHKTQANDEDKDDASPQNVNLANNMLSNNVNRMISYVNIIFILFLVSFI